MAYPRFHLQCGGDDIANESTKDQKELARDQKEKVRQLVRACFEEGGLIDAAKKGHKVWNCKYCGEFKNKILPNSTIQRPLHHVLGCSETGGNGGCKPCSGASFPVEARNQLRALYTLPEWKPAAEPRQSSSMLSSPAKTFTQISIQDAMNTKKAEDLQWDMCRVFYVNDLDFALADSPSFRSFLSSLATSGLKSSTPLTRNSEVLFLSGLNILQFESSRL